MKKYVLACQKQEKILKFLQNNLKGYSYSNFLRALRQKDIVVNGERISSNITISINDSVEIYLPERKNVLDIFYEDDNIIIFNKPKKVEVVDGDFNLSQQYESQFGKKIYAVHRLDANTTGLVIFAKSEEILSRLIEQFKKHNVDKYYLAVVFGKPKDCEVFEDYLVKYDKFVKIFDKKVKNSQKIITKYKKIKDQGELSLLEVEIQNGKMHQIRAHLAFHNLPILGDEKYGDSKLNKIYKQSSQCLQSYKIEFNVDDKKLSYLNNISFELKKQLDIQNISKIYGTSK